MTPAQAQQQQQQQSYLPAFASQPTQMVATAPVMQPVAPQNFFAPAPQATHAASMQMYGAAPMMSTAATPVMASAAPAGQQQSFFPMYAAAAPTPAPAPATHSYAHYAAQPIQLQSFSYTPVPANQLFMANPATPQPGGFGAYGAPAAQPVAATPAPPKQPEPSRTCLLLYFLSSSDCFSAFANLDPLRGMKMQPTPAPVMTPSKPAAPTLGNMPAYVRHNSPPPQDCLLTVIAASTAARTNHKQRQQ